MAKHQMKTEHSASPRYLAKRIEPGTKNVVAEEKFANRFKAIEWAGANPLLDGIVLDLNRASSKQVIYKKETGR